MRLMRRALVFALAGLACLACGSKPPAPVTPPPAPKPEPAPEPPPPTTPTGLNLGLEDGTLPTAVEVTIAGTVVAPDGKPVAGAVVALVPPLARQALHVASTSADGRFSFTAPEGSYGLTATSASAAADYLDVRDYSAPAGDVTLTLHAGGFLLTGTVRATTRAVPVGSRVAISRISDYQADLFYTTLSETGFTVMLPDGEYTAQLDSKEYLSEPARIRSETPEPVALTASYQGPPPEEVVAWITQAAVPLTTVEAEHGFDDLKPLAKMIGDARVVALGEATHGTREFFQMKHRMLEYLVSELGFTVFAIEANWPEALVVDEYVMTGKGSAAEAVAGMYFWTWNTEEVVEMVEWMRRWNADPKHKKKVRFYGFDVQFVGTSHDAVLAYLAKVDAAYGKKVGPALQPFASSKLRADYPKLADADKQALRAAAEELRARFSERKQAWVKASSLAEWRLAEHHAALLVQAEAMYSDGSLDARDKAMADNVRWILDTEPKGTRVALWAHNGHISTGEGNWVNQGRLLKKALGDEYLTLGFVYSHGAFQAKSSSAGNELTEFVQDAPGDSDVSVPFRRAGHPLSVVDLRRAPAGLVADWFADVHPMRETGAMFSASFPPAPVRLSRRFDAVIFVEKTTRARSSAVPRAVPR